MLRVTTVSMKPGVHVKESIMGRCYRVSSFHILILLPTEFLRATSAWHRTPTGSSHTWGCAEVSEPLGTQRWWHSYLYSVQGNAKFVSPMYKHTPMLPFFTGSYIQRCCVDVTNVTWHLLLHGKRVRKNINEVRSSARTVSPQWFFHVVHPFARTEWWRRLRRRESASIDFWKIP